MSPVADNMQTSCQVDHSERVEYRSCRKSVLYLSIVDVTSEQKDSSVNDYLDDDKCSDGNSEDLDVADHSLGLISTSESDCCSCSSDSVSGCQRDRHGPHAFGTSYDSENLFGDGLCETDYTLEVCQLPARLLWRLSGERSSSVPPPRTDRNDTIPVADRAAADDEIEKPTNVVETSDSCLDSVDKVVSVSSGVAGDGIWSDDEDQCSGSTPFGYVKFIDPALSTKRYVICVRSFC